MARTNKSAKAAGSRFEREVADYLRDNLSEFIDRQVKTGALDKGDIANVRDSYNNKIAVECKNTTRLDLPKWTAEAHAEAVNLGGLVGVVVHKRHGVGDIGQQWVAMTLDDLIKLLEGGAR